MEQAILDQLMKVSEQIGSLKTEMNKRFEALEAKMDRKFEEVDKKFKEVDKKFISTKEDMAKGFKEQKERMDNFEKMFYENTNDTSSIFGEIFKSMSRKQDKVN